jgi:hypothetical protein
MNQNICFTRDGKHDTSYTYCIDTKNIHGKIEVDETNVLGQGSYGVVLGGKIGRIPIAFKMIPIDVPIPTKDCGLKSDGGDCLKYTEQEFKDEVEVAKQFGDLYMTPKLYYSDLIELSKFSGPQNSDELDAPQKIGVMILERFGKSLQDWIKTDVGTFLNHEEQIYQENLNLLKDLHEMGYFNMDSHFGNILYDGQTVKLLDLMPKKTNLTWDEVQEKIKNGWDFEKKRFLRKYGHLDESNDQEDKHEDQDEDNEDEDNEDEEVQDEDEDKDEDEEVQDEDEEQED